MPVLVVNGPDRPDRLDIPPDTTMIFLDDHYDVIHLDQVISEAGYQGPICSQFLDPPVMKSADPLLSLPVMLAEMAHNLSFVRKNLPDTLLTENCFNFMIYKPRVFRLHALKAIEWFNLSTTCYTASVSHSMMGIPVPENDDPDSEVREWIQSFSKPWKTADRVVGERASNNYNWLGDLRGFLGKDVFGPSAVALITETLEPGLENSMFFTEKSIYPMLCGNFPIWLGGKKQARFWSRFGFDTFDDVIDHSYQDRDTHLQRIYYAVKDNLKLLTDLNYASEVRKKMHERLMGNRSVALNGFADQYNDKIVEQMSGKIKTDLEQLLKTHRGFRRYGPI